MNRAFSANVLATIVPKPWHVAFMRTYVKGTLLERLEHYIDKTEGCWFWTGGYSSTGYGAIGVDGKGRSPHRVLYELMVGPVPEGLDLDHLCRNRKCVNYSHLEPVTRRVNLLRGETTLAAKNAAKTHCLRGHEFTECNTYIGNRKGNKIRECRECKRLRARKNYALKRLVV